MNKHQWNFYRNCNIFIQENAFESVVCEMAAMLSRPQCVNSHNYTWNSQRYEIWHQEINHNEYIYIEVQVFILHLRIILTYHITPGYEIAGFAGVWSCVHDCTCWSWEKNSANFGLLIYLWVINNVAFWYILVHFQIFRNYMTLYLKFIYLLK